MVGKRWFGCTLWCWVCVKEVVHTHTHTHTRTHTCTTPQNVTDQHFRHLMRLITRKTLLYTPMIVDTTIIHNPDSDRFLAFEELERPLALQVRGAWGGGCWAARVVPS